MSKWREEKIQLNGMERNFVPLVSSSLIAQKGFAEGKMLPVMFLDLKERQDVIELIDNHRYLDGKNGECIGSWITEGKKIGKKIGNEIKLLLDFKKPTPCKLIIIFDIQKQGFTVDMIIKKWWVLDYVIRKGNYNSNHSR